VLIILVLYLFSRRLSTIFALDLKAIERLLAQVKDNHFDQHPSVESRLKETGNIMRSIEGLAGEILQYQNQLMTVSNTDELTGLYNRRAFNQKAKGYFELARRGVNISVVALDMDYLKTANDRFGHAVGDQLLQALAACLKAHTRGADTVARLGGDEFIVMLVQCERSDVLPWFNKISAAFVEQQKTIFPENVDPGRPCTISAGLAQASERDNSIDDVIKRADEALYIAKGAGRGQLRSSTGEL
jgi:diguanylate cyclase (GGDEF)-like protein